MITQLVMIFIFMTTGLFGVVGAARTYLRRPPPPEEFGKLFLQGWMWAGLLVMGTVSLIQLLIREADFTRMPLLSVIVVVFLFAGFPARVLATRWYRGTSAESDFVEDASGNPVAAVPPEGGES
jgi:hypothetical protein